LQLTNIYHHILSDHHIKIRPDLEEPWYRLGVRCAPRYQLRTFAAPPPQLGTTFW